MTDAPLLELRDVGKDYGSVIALDGISTTVRAGEVTCVLGDNGAGKSTLIKILAGVQVSGVQIGTTGLTSAIDFIVVAVIGGCLLTGGYGSAVGAAVGALLYGVLRQGISLAGWDPRWFQALLGVLLLVALLATGVVRRRQKAVPRS